MRESPRIRRLKNDRKAMDKLRSESSIIDFDTTGEPTDKYIVRFHGNGIWRPNGGKNVALRKTHDVRIVLGASYPRMMPELTWVSHIYHPNISASGVVCLGGYGTHWVPSLSLDELCEMLWDMIRYQNFDVESPYNREAALWARSQTTFHFPVDGRPIRDRVASGAVVPAEKPKPARSATSAVSPDSDPGLQPEVVIIEDGGHDEDEIIDAELVDTEGVDEDIVFLD